MSYDEQPAEGSKWDIHYHDHSTEHKVRVIAHCKHCARCRFERKNADCVVLAVAPVADDQPDGDIHGECAAEIRRIEGDVTIWRNSAEAQTERLKEAEGAIADGKKPDLVPGVVHCARCNFRLNRVTLYMGNGAIGPGGSETEQCPNGCGPMWPVTWKQEAEDAYKTAESQFERAKAAEDQLDACLPYLKEGETPAECLARNRADVIRLMGLLGAEKKAHERARTALDKIAQTTGSDDPCRPFLKEGETAADALARMSRLVNAVDCTDFYGIKCENIDGKNWFDVRGKTKDVT